MFITFSSDNENISYFNEVATQLLSLMGHSGTVPGALKANEVPQALNNLQTGLQKEKKVVQNQEDDEEEEISLAKRAIPLIQLMQVAIEKECDLLWSPSKSPN